MEELDQYILDHSDKEPDYLYQLTRRIHLKLVNPRMSSGHLQGRLLKMLTQMIKPKRVLELGTFAAYSTLAMAEGLESNAIIDTIEVDDELEDFINESINGTQYASQINLMIGDALQIIPTLNHKYDMIFVDANKRDYIKYFDLLWDKWNVGGYMLVDNTLWSGKVIQPHKNNDYQTIGIKAFNDFIAQNKDVEKVILPIRDGLTLIRKL